MDEPPMLLNTRRRVLGLLAAAAGSKLLLPRSAFAQAKALPSCYASKVFKPWTAQATDSSAGAKISPLTIPAKCDLLRASIEVSETYDAKLILFGDPEATHLHKRFLLKPSNVVFAKNAQGKTLEQAPLCGVCTGIFDNKVSIVLPLRFSALLRSEDSLTLVVRLGTIEDCGFTLDLKTLRSALQWASAEKQKLNAENQAGKCQPPANCFITTACCELLGLPDDCFELRMLRRYRDEVLATQPGGKEAITLYYESAPGILSALPAADRSGILLGLYWRYILPSALAAKLGLNRLAYRLYAHMMRQLGIDDRALTISR